jgi:hypothetical protein
MRLTIVPADGAVYLDGVVYMDLDLSTCNIPSDVHALQWYDTYGELEFNRSFVNGQIVHPANEMLTELPAWANTAKTVWDEAKANEEAAILAAQQAAEEARLLAEQEAALLAAEQEAQATEGNQ